MTEMHMWETMFGDWSQRQDETDLRSLCAFVSSALLPRVVKSCLVHFRLHHSKTNCNVLRLFQGKKNTWYVCGNVYHMTLFDLWLQMNEGLAQLYGDIQSKDYINNALILMYYFSLIWELEKKKKDQMFCVYPGRPNANKLQAIVLIVANMHNF